MASGVKDHEDVLLKLRQPVCVSADCPLENRGVYKVCTRI